MTVGMVSTNCYLAMDRESGLAFLVDPGDDAPGILQMIREEGVNVTHVILTHGHFDHVLAVPAVLQETGAKLVVHEKELPLLSDPALAGYRSFQIPNFRPLHADLAVKDGDTLQIGGMHLSFLHTPGHTPGGMCILADGVLFSGDTLFAGSCGRCDLPGGDYRVILQSLKKLAELAGDYPVYPGHEESSTLDAERAHNPYLREAMGR